MIRSLALSLLCWMPFVQAAETRPEHLRTFAQTYFDAWNRTQMPGVSADDLEAYLALLTEDVGHQHLPYDGDEGRQPDGKTRMREGMTHYLGAHTAYEATLGAILVGHDVIVLQYVSNATGVRPDTGETVAVVSDMTEILEIDGGRVSMIRKYGE